MTIPTLDVETVSAAGYVLDDDGRWHAPPGAREPGIAAVGSAVYTEHPTTEVLTVSFDTGDGRGVRRWKPGQPVPFDLMQYVLAGGTFEFHKADFERGVWWNILTPRYGWPHLPIAQQRCSMAKAYVAQYPGALEKLGDVLGTDTTKDKRGKALIKRFSVPQQPIPGLMDKRTGRVKREPVPAHWITPNDDPEQFEAFEAYCDTDVTTAQEASARMPNMTPDELDFWLIDQEINQRGLGVDVEGVEACVDILNQVLVQYGEECRQLTGFNVTQLEKLKGWLAAYGCHVASLDADALDAALARTDLHPTARRVLELRQLTGSASVKKTYGLANMTSADGRLRNTIVHHKTRTGRPGGADVQPLNLPKAGPKLVPCVTCRRPHREAPTCPWCSSVQPPAFLRPPEDKPAWRASYVDPVLEIMQTRCLPMVEAYFGDALLCISGCVRGLFVAAPGHDLIASDYSSIEAVVAAELAGETWRQEAFREGKPIYLLGASKITGRSLDEYLAYHEAHGEHHLDRQKIGKVSELACLAGRTLVWARPVNGNGKAMRPRWVRLDKITTNHRVYDGRGFVRHEGLIARGRKAVETRAGIVATPDHEFFVKGRKVRFDQIDERDWPLIVDDVLSLFTPLVDLTNDSPTTAETYDILNAGPRRRFVVASAHGPVLASNCGYGGWVGSYKAFGSTEPDDVIKAQILAWREASPTIVEMWGGQFRGLPWDRFKRPELYGVEGMAIAAVQSPGRRFDYRGIGFERVQDAYGDRLLVTLLSGRQLTYHEPILTPGKGWANDELGLSYMTWNSNPKYGPMGWVRMETYGGRLFENIVQAVAHDILRHGIRLLRAAGYPTVLHVYDEIVVEVRHGTGSIDEVERLMAMMPWWARGWPIRASGGWRGFRFRKG